MSVHIRPITDRIVFEVRWYDAEDADAAYHRRDRYCAVAAAIWYPLERRVVIEAAHGALTPGGISEALAAARDLLGVETVIWERASGKVTRMRWDDRFNTWRSAPYGG